MHLESYPQAIKVLLCKYGISFKPFITSSANCSLLHLPSFVSGSICVLTVRRRANDLISSQRSGGIATSELGIERYYSHGYKS